MINKLLLGSGAMKAGTTWLYNLLLKNKEFYFTPEKEIHFWYDYACGGNVLSVENRLRNAKNALHRQKFNYLVQAKRTTEWYADYLSKDLTLSWYLELF